MSVQCNPPAMILGGVAICTVTVTDFAANSNVPPGGSVVFASDNPGSFNGSCNLFPVGEGDARCQVVYTPSRVGSGLHRITAIYGGDVGHQPGQSDDLIGVSPQNGGHPTTTALECPSTVVAVGKATTCKATVTDTTGAPNVPTRGIVFGSDAPGLAAPERCPTLTAEGQNKASCSVTYTPSAIGSGEHTLTAAYEGDSRHEPSQVTRKLRVIDPAHETTVDLSCDP